MAAPDVTAIGTRLDDPDDLESRRLKVLSLRLRRMTITEIAAALQVDKATISRDLEWIRQNWRERYGAKPDIDPAEMVGEALALYAEVERQALREYTTIASTAAAVGLKPAQVSRTRMACLREAREARSAQVNLLMDVGWLDRALGSIQLNLPRAAEIRRMLKDVVSDDIIEGMLVPDIERPQLGAGE